MPQMAGWVKEAGFTEYLEVESPVPIGTWPKDKRLKEVGKYYLVHFLIGEFYIYTRLRNPLTFLRHGTLQCSHVHTEW